MKILPKQKIKIKVLTKGCEPKITVDGDWIDLRSATDVNIQAPYAKTSSRKTVVVPQKLVPLGVAMQLPKGMEAVVVPRSSSNKKYNIIQANHFGVIDQTYCGPNDQWYMPVLATGGVKIDKGDRICQFKIQLSQKATVWQKIKWFFSNGIELVFVDKLERPNRGGLGHSGKK